MKNIKIFICAILLSLSSVLPVFALPDSKSYENGIFVIDELDEFSDEEKLELNEYAKYISDNLGIDIVYIQTVDCDGMPIEEYAKKALEQGGWLEPTIVLVYEAEENLYIEYMTESLREIYDEDYIEKLWGEMVKVEGETFANPVKYYMTSVAQKYDEIYHDGQFFDYLSIDDKANKIENDEDITLLEDNANLIPDDKESDLLKKAENISKKYNIDVVIATVDSLNGQSIEEFADKFYKDREYNKDGIMLLLSDEDRDYRFYESGKIYKVFTTYWEDYILTDVLAQLKENKYAEAFNIYLDKTQEVVSQIKEDGTLPKPPINPLLYVGGVAGGFLIAFIIVSIGKSSLKSVAFNRTANNYLKEGSLNLRNSSESFLYRNVTRREKPKPKENSSSDSRSSGSSGGRSGKY
ncbi:PF04536 family protein [Peptoanaerobacter stomatis]|uniref:PF04536 family protein n=1 Tax=Peptoanaerobacter stomatis TaxID=796937 RepID=J6HMJ4_9FIRM|nr:TPM domain-containing protein [Peptoanaerobacter stomatis]EJU23608.1 PF04536 family protein [Peptoanaerobacter stomatis]NWO24348.1 TPM domain-containing protein [Peptostreptococcaceae bacterium oral taxon 081]